MDAWEAILGLLQGSVPMTGTYSVDVNGKRIPSMVPGNTQWLTPAIKAEKSPALSTDQIIRALAYAQQTGNWKEEKAPMSPLGSEFDFFNPSAARLWDLRRMGYSINR